MLLERCSYDIGGVVSSVDFAETTLTSKTHINEN